MWAGLWNHTHVRISLGRLSNCLKPASGLAMHAVQLSIGGVQYANSNPTRQTHISAQDSKGLAFAATTTTCVYSLVPGMLALRVFVQHQND